MKRKEMKMQGLKMGFDLDDNRFPERRFWTFMHKPGTGGGAEAEGFMTHAYELNECLMQYEYPFQDKGKVTRHWQLISQIKKGDIVFLRGNDRLYAYGVVVPHGISEGDGVVVSSVAETIDARSNGQLHSGCFSGKVIFKDSEVFFEDLGDCWLDDEDGECSEQGWGQRIRVQKWLDFNKTGIFCTGNENYVSTDVYSAIRELKPESASKFIRELGILYREEKGVDTMILELLKENMNLVLTGAPGTGKTYLAGGIADCLTDGDDNRIVRVQFHPSYGYADFVEGLRPVKREGTKEIGFERRDGVFMALCREAIKHQDEHYVVVIDEINRGDISKIFGELFSLIEADYRTFNGVDKNGNSVVVKTQYNNLMDENDIFKNGFFVPPNVYIIGTMNDVDRSVESMDFAIRRRFVWHEVKPEDRFDAMWGEAVVEGVERDEVKSRMNALNEKIRNDSTLGEAYQIGPSYFMKMKDLKGDYEQLWNQSLRFLLKEYLRGMPDAAKKLDEFHSELVGSQGK